MNDQTWLDVFSCGRGRQVFCSLQERRNLGRFTSRLVTISSSREGWTDLVRSVRSRLARRVASSQTARLRTRGPLSRRPVCCRHFYCRRRVSEPQFVHNEESKLLPWPKSSTTSACARLARTTFGVPAKRVEQQGYRAIASLIQQM